MANGRYSGGGTTETPTSSAPVVADFRTDPAANGDAARGKLTPSDADADAVKTRNIAAASILAALVLLWAFGGLVFKDARV